MKKLFVLLLVGFGFSAQAQNQINLGQYMIHQPFLNPAASASYQKTTFAAFYRSQWTQFTGAPVTQGFNAIVPLKKFKHHLSFTAFHDAIGINNNSEVSVSYAYTVKAGLNSYLSFGLSGSLDLLQSDYSLLHTIDQNDPLFQAASPLIPLPDFKFGIYYYKNRFYAGIALPNFMNNQVVFTSSGVSKGNTEFDVNDLHYFFQLGYSWKLSEKADFNTSTLIKQVAGAPMQFDLNAQFMYNKKFGIGGSYRSSNEILAMLTFNITQAFRFSYGYEYNLGQIGNYSSGSHEVMMIYQLNPPNETIVSVPRF